MSDVVHVVVSSSLLTAAVCFYFPPSYEVRRVGRKGGGVFARASSDAVLRIFISISLEPITDPWIWYYFLRVKIHLGIGRYLLLSPDLPSSSTLSHG
ncbi:hypothetical protein F5Y14DRAFT_97660 [Nemania sp. NC0429]|nr:hypothetical protein F5Y14DRAFT_97660 [Nemania sp. NC0429]